VMMMMMMMIKVVVLLVGGDDEEEEEMEQVRMDHYEYEPRPAAARTDPGTRDPTSDGLSTIRMTIRMVNEPLEFRKNHLRVTLFP
jgi:hypothetical protein